MIARHHAGEAAKRWSAWAFGRFHTWTVPSAVALIVVLTVGASPRELRDGRWAEVVEMLVYVCVGFAVPATVRWWRWRRHARRDVVHEQLRWGPWAVDGTAVPAATTTVGGWLRDLWPILVFIPGAFGLIAYAAWRNSLAPAILAVPGTLLIVVWYRLESRWKRALTLDTGSEPWRPGARRTAVLRVRDGAAPMALTDVRLRVVQERPPMGRVVTHREPVGPAPRAVASGQEFELAFDLPSAEGTRYDLESPVWWELRLLGEWNGRSLEWYFLLPVFGGDEEVRPRLDRHAGKATAT